VDLPIDVSGAAAALRDARPPLLVMAVACESATFVSAWALQRLVLRARSWGQIAVPQLVGNAASNVLPAGSAVGSVLQIRLLTRRGIDLTRAIVSLAFAGMLTLLAGLVLFPVIALIPLGDNKVSPVAGIPLAIVFLAVLAPVFVVALRGERPTRWLARNCQGMLKRVARTHAPDDLADRIVHERDEIRDALRGRTVFVSAAATGYSLGDYFALYASLLAVGMRPSPAVVLVAFMAANAAGLVPFTPGGLGFVEAGLTGTLVLAGASPEQALAAVTIYRLVSCWIPVAVGVTAYAVSVVANRATAAAPTSGPSRPSPAGTIRAPRENSSLATSSNSAWAAVKNGSPKPSATEPATTASLRSRRLTTEPTARPTNVPARTTRSADASLGARPVIARMAVPDASASRQPRAPHAQRRPPGTTIT
jgi:hypothetical protein